MSREAALDEDVAGLDVPQVAHRRQLLLERRGPGIGEHDIEIAAEALVAAAGRPGTLPRDAIAAHDRTFTLGPARERRAIAAGEVESDGVETPGREQILGAQA